MIDKKYITNNSITFLTFYILYIFKTKTSNYPETVAFHSAYNFQLLYEEQVGMG